MLKAICKNVVWMAVPLSLALGCAANQPQTDASYKPVETLTATSGEPEQRIYGTVDPATVSVNGSVDAPPAKADPASWGLAEEIREKMMADQSLARVGNSLIAEVGADGVVTVKGRVGSPSEKEHVHDMLSNLPGVKGVNDDALGIGKSTGNGTVDMR